MNIVKEWKHEDVFALELGYGPYWPPLMNVMLYFCRGTLIDSAQSHMRQTVLDWTDDKAVKRILLTHHHEDHSGSAAAVALHTKAEIFAHPLTLQKMATPNRILPYQRWVWGHSEPLVGSPFDETEHRDDALRLKPIHAPGHSKDHCVFLAPDEGWLFSGDLYLGDRIRYFRSDECLGDQIDSIRSVLKYDFEVLFCAHHPKLKHGKRHLVAKLQFLEDFQGLARKLQGQGKPLRAICREIGIKESWFVRGLTMGNVSLRNMVVSALEEESDAGEITGRTLK